MQFADCGNGYSLSRCRVINDILARAMAHTSTPRRTGYNSDTKYHADTSFSIKRAEGDTPKVLKCHPKVQCNIGLRELPVQRLQSFAD